MNAPAEKLSVDFQGQLGAFELNAAFAVPMRGVTALFGPSGCGKTTILRCIAGLEKLTGTLRVGRETWHDSQAGLFVPPHKRHIGYVFQEASLFPHLDVKANLLYGAKRAAGGILSDAKQFDEIIALLGISKLLDRSPLTLSGGERQRVAVGRALLSKPRVLLMDEPLSALDRITKEEILPYFEVLHETLALPIIYVTHDFGEVERLADSVILLEAGRVVGAGSLPELQTDARLPLLRAREASVVIEGRIAGFDNDYDLTRVSIDGGELWVPGRQGKLGDTRRLSISVSDVSLSLSAPMDSTIVNSIAAVITEVDGSQSGPQVNLILSLGENGNGCRIAARITRKSMSRLGIVRGQKLYAQIKSVALVATRAGQD